jgi:hypothetical protein
MDLSLLGTPSGDSEPGLTVSFVSTETMRGQSSKLAIRTDPVIAMVDATGHGGFMTGAMPLLSAIVPMPPICRRVGREKHSAFLRVATRNF